MFFAVRERWCPPTAHSGTLTESKRWPDRCARRQWRRARPGCGSRCPRCRYPLRSGPRSGLATAATRPPGRGSSAYLTAKGAIPAAPISRLFGRGGCVSRETAARPISGQLRRRTISPASALWISCCPASNCGMSTGCGGKSSPSSVHTPRCFPLQNGVDAAERMTALLGLEPVMGGMAFVTGTIVAPGVIRQTGTYQQMTFGDSMAGSASAARPARSLRSGRVRGGAERGHHGPGLGKIHLAGTAQWAQRE